MGAYVCCDVILNICSPFLEAVASGLVRDEEGLFKFLHMTFLRYV